MSESLDKVFPDALAVGGGVVCTSSPILTAWIWDFYDGPTEGIARLRQGDRLVYFKKIWWDESQDSRLFFALVFRESELRGSNAHCYERVSAGLEGAAASLSPANASDQGKDLTEVAEAISTLQNCVRVHIFCTQITRELFVLPVLSA